MGNSIKLSFISLLPIAAYDEQSEVNKAMVGERTMK